MINIIYEDKDILICIKPPNTVCEDIKLSSISLPQLLIAEHGYKELYTVHRLDKEVSGLIVYAKTQAAAADLSTQITNGTLKKEYVTEVHGKLEKKNGSFVDFLFHDKSKNKTYVVKKERRGVKHAELEYDLISYDELSNTSLVNIKLITGRTHQIRVQFSSRGHAVLGDRKYGSGSNEKPVKLYSKKLAFRLPFTHNEVCFESLPEWIK